jgi:hypothetical protein
MYRSYWRRRWWVAGAGAVVGLARGYWQLTADPDKYSPAVVKYGPALEGALLAGKWLLLFTLVLCLVSRRRRALEARQDAYAAEEARAEPEDSGAGLTAAQQELMRRLREVEATVPPPPVQRSDWVPTRVVLAGVLPIILLGVLALVGLSVWAAQVQPTKKSTSAAPRELTADDRQEIAGIIAAVADDPTRVAAEKPRLWAMLDRLGPARDATSRRLLARAQVTERWNRLVWKGILESCQARRVIPSSERERVGLDLVAQGAITESRRQEDEKQIKEAVALTLDPKTGGVSTGHPMADYARKRLESAKQIDAALVELFTRPK